MLITIIIGIFGFILMAAMISQGYNQLKMRHEQQLRDRIIQLYLVIRERRNIIDAVPANYLPNEVRAFFITEILSTLKKILTINGNDQQAKMMYNEYLQQLEMIKAGQFVGIHRKAASLTEAETIHQYMRLISDILKKKHQQGLINTAEMATIHQKIEQCYVQADIDGELTLAETSTNEGKLQTAFYHYDRLVKLMCKYNLEGRYNNEIDFVQNQLKIVQDRLEASGEIVNTDSTNNTANKAWNKLLDEEAKYTKRFDDY